jgi:chromosome partitioning protein
MKTICVSNSKGGIGKTTTAQALYEILQKKGYKVLGIDLDTQGNFTQVTSHHGNQKTVTHLIKGTPIKEVIEDDFIACDYSIMNVDGEDYKADFLRESLKGLKGYDFCIIDTPPRIDRLTLTAFVASNYVISTATTDSLAIQGVADMLKAVKSAKKQNKSLKPLGLLFVRYSPRSVLSKNIVEDMKQRESQTGLKVFNTTIRESIAIREAQYMGESLVTYAKKSKAMVDYTAFVEEVLKLIK